MKSKAAIFGIVLVVLAVATFVQAYAYYGQNWWALDQSKRYLYLASTSPDMPKMIEYMARAGGYLQPYSGNPSFTLSPYNDFNTIKERMASTIATMQMWTPSAKPVQDYAYQQAVTNIHSTITDIIYEIGDTKEAMLLNPAWNPVGYVFLVAYLAYVVAMIAVAATPASAAGRRR